MTLSLTSTSFIRNSSKILLKLNIAIKFPLIPEGTQHQNSRLAARHSSRLNSFTQHDPPRNFLINSLDHTKSLHDPVPTLSHYDFQTVCVLYTQFSTSLCWNQQTRTKFLTESNH